MPDQPRLPFPSYDTSDLDKKAEPMTPSRFSPELRQDILNFAVTLHKTLLRHGRTPGDVHDSLPRKGIPWALSFGPHSFLYRDGPDTEFRDFKEVPDVMLPYVVPGLVRMFRESAGLPIGTLPEHSPYGETDMRKYYDTFVLAVFKEVSVHTELLDLCRVFSNHLVMHQIAARARYGGAQVRREMCCSTVEFAMPQEVGTTWKYPADLLFADVPLASGALLIMARSILAPDADLPEGPMTPIEVHALIRNYLNKIEKPMTTKTKKEQETREYILAGAAEIFDVLAKDGHVFGTEPLDTGNALAMLSATGDGFTVKPKHEPRYLPLADVDDALLYAATWALDVMVESSTWGTQGSRAQDYPKTAEQASNRMGSALTCLRAFVDLRQNAITLAERIVEYSILKRHVDKIVASGPSGRISLDPSTPQPLQIHSSHGGYIPGEMLLKGTLKNAYLLAQLAFQFVPGPKTTLDVLSVGGVSERVQKALDVLADAIAKHTNESKPLTPAAQAPDTQAALSAVIETWILAAIDRKLPEAMVTLTEGFVLAWKPNSLKLVSRDESGPLLSYPSGPRRLEACRALATLTKEALAELEEARELERQEIQAASDALSLFLVKG